MPEATTGLWPWVQQMLQLLWPATVETLWMVLPSALGATLLGLPLGVLLVILAPGQVAENRPLHQGLSWGVNAGRSFPFIILMVAVIPFTRAVVGTTIGTAAAIVPLTIAAIPFVARLAESSLLEVDSGLVEAALAMGATPLQIVRKVLLPEALPSLILGSTLTVITLVGYSAMAGAIGGGGLGDLAIRYGYMRFQTDVMVVTVVVLIALVQVLQVMGDGLSRALYRRRSG